jgi:hypothetical protein
MRVARDRNGEGWQEGWVWWRGCREPLLNHLLLQMHNPHEAHTEMSVLSATRAGTQDDVRRNKERERERASPRPRTDHVDGRGGVVGVAPLTPPAHGPSSDGGPWDTPLLDDGLKFNCCQERPASKQWQGTEGGAQGSLIPTAVVGGSPPTHVLVSGPSQAFATTTHTHTHTDGHTTTHT